MTGNFIGDFVKGKQYEAYSPGISMGIKLHRSIDHFTDQHPLVRKINQIFKPDFKRYSGVVSDIAFDHLLAKHWKKYHNQTLDEFASWCYDFLLERLDVLPERMQYILPKIIASKRLQSYESMDKTADAIVLMSNFRSFYFDKSIFKKLMHERMEVIETDFFAFFDDMMEFVRNQKSI